MKYFFVFFAIASASLSSAQDIPKDAAPYCQIDRTTFNQWFKSGTPGLNGFVNPANSVGFSESSVCDFYAWAKQMFLWITSPVGVSRVFDSPVFYDISPPDSSGRRIFLPHTGASFVHTMLSRPAKEGPHDLPVVQDKAGQLFEVMKPLFNNAGDRIIVDSAGNLEEVSKVSIAANRKLDFRDRSGKAVAPSAPTLPLSTSSPNTIRTAQEFIVDGASVFVDSGGNIIDVEQGQAGSFAVLETQKNGLVYYTAMTNDVYAYFLTGAKDGVIGGGQFPTTATDLAGIQKYAASHGKAGFSDAQALTLELKSSWIELPPGAKGNYITTSAIIPVYDRSDPKKWVLNGKKKATLGLLGLHIVGGVLGHPEMIWATFEHFSDTPNADYSYMNTSNQSVKVSQSTAGSWLFSASGSSGPFNTPHMKASGTDIIAEPNYAITPSDSLRKYPWGAAGGNASANTNLISIQNSVAAFMPTGDIRSNYFLVGATWTTAGTAPPSGQAGATNVSNSTMETYTQLTGGCFKCHSSGSSSPSLAPDVLSHIFGSQSTGLKPLFPAAKK